MSAGETPAPDHDRHGDDHGHRYEDDAPTTPLWVPPTDQAPPTPPAVSATRRRAGAARSWAARLWARLVARLPLWLRQGQAARDAAADAAWWVLRVPVRFLRAVVRGLVAVLRRWRAWVTVRDYREAAEHAEKLADRFIEIRELTLFRWKVTGAVAAVVTVGGFIAWLIDGARPLWVLAATAALVLAFVGRRSDGSPGRAPVLAGPRSLTWTMDPQVLVDAFRDAKLIGKDESLRLVERSRRQGEGWAVTVDLPATRKAADVIKGRESLASALAVDEIQLIVERMRGAGGHAGRVSMWVADKDPYSAPPVRNPLLDADRWDAWWAVPFGRDARDRPVELPLVFTSLLVGAIPRQGKTFAARLPAAGLILDPFARLYVADFKAGKDWYAARQVAHRFMAGDESSDVLEFLRWLAELITDVQGRFKRMQSLDETVCPESKLTPTLSRHRRLNMPVTALIVDECQIPLEDRTPVEVGGKKIPAGEYVAELLVWLVRKAPAAGVVVILATQRPDSTTIPSKLRAVLGSRFALRVMDWRDSNIVLGEQMNTRGYDSSRLFPSHKGVGILRPDSESGADVLALTVRTYYMPGEDWRVICERGRALRENAGTLTGDAAGHRVELTTARPVLGIGDTSKALDDSGETDVDNAGKSDADGAEDPADAPDLWPTPEAGSIPEPLGSVWAYVVQNHGGRDVIPSAELCASVGDVDATSFAMSMNKLGCERTRAYVRSGDGESRRVRVYTIASLRDAVRRWISDGRGDA